MNEQTKDNSESSQDNPKGKKEMRGASFKTDGVVVNVEI